MKIVYDATNSVEAHMIKNMLEQEGIEAHVQGEYLQGGMGELPTTGLVKVNVDDESYYKAREIIKNWETAEKQIEAVSNFNPNKDVLRSDTSFFSIFGYMLLGAACMYLYLKPTINQETVDINKDGIDDEKWTYENRVAVKSEHDRNLDGKYDEVWLYKNGLRSSYKADNNFDGKFDSEDYFENDRIYYAKTDLNFDGEIDTVINYDAQSDTNYKISMYSPKTRVVKKIQYFENDYLKSAELDANDDGILDTLIAYDIYQEEVSRKFIDNK